MSNTDTSRRFCKFALHAALSLIAFSLYISPILASNFIEVPGYFWKTDFVSAQNRMNFQLVSTNSSLTKIHFTYDSRSGRIQDGVSLDPENQILVSSPFEHLLQSHPVKFLDRDGTLEKSFLEILSELGLQLNWEKKFELLPFGEIKYVSFEEVLASQKISSQLNLDAFILQIQTGMRNFLRDFAPWPLSSDTRLIRKNLDNLNFLEAYATPVSESDKRLDAFVLFPTQTFKLESQKLCEAIRDFSESKLNPVDWFSSRSSQFSYAVRLSLVILLSHNHLSERNLIKAVAIRDGLLAAWKLALEINHAYKAESDLWLSKHSRDSSLILVYPRSSVGFLNSRRTWIVNFKSLSNHENLTVPYVQRYHYYGAFVSAMRMAYELKLPSLSVPRLNQHLGLSYKIKTKALTEDQKNLMVQIYSSAARHALEVIHHSKEGNKK